MNLSPPKTAPAIHIVNDHWTRRLSKIGAWVVFLLCGTLALVHYFGTPSDPPRAAINLLISSVGLLSLLFLKWNRQRAAVFTLLVGGWFALTLLVALSGGLYSNNVIVYPLLILLSGHFLGSRTSAFITAASFVAACILAYLHTTGSLPVQGSKPVVFPLASFFAVVGMSGLGTWFFNRSLEEHVQLQREEAAARARAEQIADEREQQLIDITDNIPGVVYQFFSRPDGTQGFHFVSQRIQEVFGIAADEKTAFREFLSHIHPEDQDRFLLTLNDAVLLRSEWSFEGRFCKSADTNQPAETIWFRGAASPSQRKDELIFSGILTDIRGHKHIEQKLLESNQKFESLNADLERRVDSRTEQLKNEIDERKHIENVLRETANRLQQIIDTIDSGLLVWSPEQTLQLWNEAFARIFPAVAPVLRVGLTRDALAPEMRSKGGLIAADQHAAQWDALGRFEVTLPDGRILEITRIATPSGGRLVMHNEVTELRRQRDALSRNERMAALGSMVAGIAHEINTPLGNALMVTSTLQDHLRDFDHARLEGALKRSTFDQFIANVRESTDQLNRNLYRSAELIRHFKQVAVDQTSDRRRQFELRSVLENIQATVANRVRKSGHQFTLQCPVGIMMDSLPGAIGQIVTNLVENAITHAVEGRAEGKMTLIVAPLNEDYIEFRFTDNGSGIPDEHLSRVFDPFFTTKLGQGGSGLGLAILLNLTRDALGGEVSLESKTGAGTTFTLKLPRVAPPQTDD